MARGGASKSGDDATVAEPAPIPDTEPLTVGLKVVYIILAGLLAFTYAFPLALDPSLHLLLLATTTIVCGCLHNSYLHYASLKWSEEHSDDADLYLKNEDAESISEEDAWKFPLMGSCVLLGLFVVRFVLVLVAARSEGRVSFLVADETFLRHRSPPLEHTHRSSSLSRLTWSRNTSFRPMFLSSASLRCLETWCT